MKRFLVQKKSSLLLSEPKESATVQTKVFHRNHQINTRHTPTINTICTSAHAWKGKSHMGVRLCLSPHQVLLKLGISLCAGQLRILFQEKPSEDFPLQAISVHSDKLYEHFWQSKSNSGYSEIHPFISQRAADYTFL